MLRFHNKAERGPERLQSYLDRNLPPARKGPVRQGRLHCNSGNSIG